MQCLFLYSCVGIDTHLFSMSITRLQDLHKKIKRNDKIFQDQDDEADKTGNFLSAILEEIGHAYKDIVIMTVAHMIMPDVSCRIEEKIIMRIAKSSIAILSLVGNKGVEILAHEDIRLQEKVGYCVFLISLLLVMRYGLISGIVENDQKNNKKEEVLDAVVLTKKEEESSYLQGKFKDYR